MKQILLAFVCFSLWFSASAQMFYTPTWDTLKYGEWTGGDLLSMDSTHISSATTIPGTGFRSGLPYANWSVFSGDQSFRRIQAPQSTNQMVFSGIPHLGFQYLFGSKGYQTVHADYQQIFKKKHVLNLEINRESRNDLTRNSYFQQNNASVKYLYRGERLRSRLNFDYWKDSTHISGGIRQPGVVDTFGIEFAPIFKDNAKSAAKNGRIQWSNYLNFISDNDSAEVQLGLMSYHELNIRNFKYYEQDSLAKLYDTLYIDSFVTRDQYQTNALRNGAGVFFFVKNVELQGGLDHTYRRIQNLGEFRDTNELGISGGLLMRFSKGFLESQNRLNLIGANREWESHSIIGVRLNRLSLSGTLHLENKFFSMLQRSYFSNHIAYTRQDEFNQFFQNLEGQAAIRLANQVYLKGGVGQMLRNKVLSFENNEWVLNQYSNWASTYAFAQAQVKFKGIGMMAKYQVTAGNDFIPSSVIHGRLSFQKRIFEAKKMEIFAKFDWIGIAGHQLMVYQPLLDIWTLNNNSATIPFRYVFNATAGFAIVDFRFFVKTENIQDFFVSGQEFVAQDYVRAPFILRIGLTWDMFN